MKKVFFTTTLLLLAFGSTYAQSDDDHTYEGEVESILRWRDDDGEAKAQAMIRLKGGVSLDHFVEGLEVRTIVQTGDRFGNAFATPYIPNGMEDSRHMEGHLSHGYLRYSNSGIVGEIGALETRRDTAGLTTQLYPFGGMTGGRVYFNLSGNDRLRIAVTMANVGDGGTPDFYNRDWEHDYTEAVAYINLGGAQLEAGVEEIHGGNFYRGVLTREFSNLLNRNVRAVLEGIYDEGNSAYRANFTIEFPLFEEESSPLLALTFLHQEEGYDNIRRWALSDNAMWGESGDAAVITLTSPPLRGGMKAYAQWRQHFEHSSMNRGDVGVTINWKGRR